MSDRKFNFSAGPAILPEAVLRRAQDSLWDHAGTGIGILEHSHRGGAFTAVIERAEALIRELAGVPDDYAVLFMQGGASSQFFMVPMNFLDSEHTADYCNTGAWSQKAIKDARRYGEVNVACSSEADKFTYIPSAAETSWSASPVYVHFTSNNTIFGTQWASEPEAPAGVPLVCDASSDIFSRPIDVTRYAMIYAGAQKNLGPAGVTVVIGKKEFLAGGDKELPAMCQYRTFVDNRSLYNTPPTFAIYVVSEVLAWIAERGGLAAMAEHNQAKARLLYDFLDNSKLFSGTARADSRSQMNVTFRTTSEDLDKQFIKEAGGRGLEGLKGHRSVGGMRASIYNAFPPEGVEALVGFMKTFEAAHA